MTSGYNKAYPGNGGRVITSFSDTFNRANIVGLGDNYIDGTSGLGNNNIGAFNPGVAGAKASFLSSLNTLAAVVNIPYVFFPLDTIKTVRGNQFAQATSFTQGVVGAALEAGLFLLTGWRADGSFRGYVLIAWMQDAVGANNSYRLCRHNQAIKTDLVLGAVGAAPSGSTFRLEARVTAGVSVELKVFINGVLKETIVDASVNRSESGAPGIGRSTYTGNGPAVDSNFTNFSCGKL